MRTQMDVVENAPEHAKERYVCIRMKPGHNDSAPYIEAIEAELLALGYTARTPVMKTEDLAEAWGVRP